MTRLPSLILFITLCLAASNRAHADSESEARRLYDAGRTAYQAEQYQLAYDNFEKAYLALPRPELLFNMASALQNLERPHDSAEKLRAYLRVRPDAPERAELEERIRALEEKQRILDARRAPVAVVATTEPPPAKTPLHKKWWLWTIVGVAAAGVAVGVTFGVLESRPAWNNARAFGPGAQ